VGESGSIGHDMEDEEIDAAMSCFCARD